MKLLCILTLALLIACDSSTAPTPSAIVPQTSHDFIGLANWDEDTVYMSYTEQGESLHVSLEFVNILSERNVKATCNGFFDAGQFYWSYTGYKYNAVFNSTDETPYKGSLIVWDMNMNEIYRRNMVFYER
jgi:hypothetical protein